LKITFRDHYFISHDEQYEYFGQDRDAFKQEQGKVNRARDSVGSRRLAGNASAAAAARTCRFPIQRRSQSYPVPERRQSSADDPLFISFY